MRTFVFRVSALMFTAAIFSFAGCRSLPKTKPQPAPAPRTASVPAKPAASSTPGDIRTLFIIERSKNANVVHYDASLNADGSLNPAEPVVAYWVLLAEDGRRKKLNWVEKKKAYGINIKPDASREGYTLTLAAARWMPMAVRKVGDTVRAEVAINGRPATLEKMFIQSRERMIGPKVEYIELYGKDLQTGEACREKIVPK